MKKWKRKCAMLLALVLCLSSLQTVIVNATQENDGMLEEQNANMESDSGGQSEEAQPEEVQIEEASIDTVDDADTKKAWDGITMQDTWEADAYAVTFSLNNYWQDGYTANIIIENKSEEDMEGWFLKFLLADDITNMWNASIEQVDEGVLTIKNIGWNQNIPAGGSVTFGFNASSAFNGFPETYSLLWSGSEKTEIPTEDYAIDYLADSEWEDGFSGRILITNNTDQIIAGWRLSFDFARDINRIWCAEIDSIEDGRYAIKNAGYNANIAPGQTISFGFKGSGGVNSDVPSNFYLYSYDLNGESAGSSQTGGNSNTGSLTEEDLETDTDGDGLTDAFEKIWGLNPEEPDTDGDGLTDYEEIYLTHTSPFMLDTDENGISDAEEDLDLDGLDNLQEIQYGTNPADNDTDGDNLLDNEEIHTYGTDPIRKDTDGDGLSDYDDILLGFSPLLVDTDGNGISDGEERVSQTMEQEFNAEEGKGLTKVCVSMDTFGNLENSMEILNMDQVDLLSSDVVGLVGVPVEISTSAAFETAELTFYYDEASLGDTQEEDLSMLWYDEENSWYQMLDCTVDTENNRVSYTTTHFSTYMLIDSKEWINAWRQNIAYGSSTEEEQKQNFDIVFIIDVTSEQHGGKNSLTRGDVINIVDVMQDGDEAVVISSNGNYSVTVGNFHNSKSSLKATIASVYEKYQPTFRSGQFYVLKNALTILERQKNDKEKVIVLISDNVAVYDEATIATYIKQNIKIYTVALEGNSLRPFTFEIESACVGPLERLAELTGGQHYELKHGSEMDLNFTYSVGTVNAPIDTTDTDGDGLYDIYETAGMILPNGRIIYTDPNKADTDGDGLTDYEETGIIYNIDNRYIKSDESAALLKYFKMRSNPTCSDTDGDGYTDYWDPHPWLKEDEWVAKLNNQYAGTDYLKIQLIDGNFIDGGYQGWWRDKAYDKWELDLFDSENSKAYRLVNLGCGVIAMCDMELYLTQQNSGYQAFWGPDPYILPYDAATGIIQKADYREYVERRFQFPYWIPNSVAGYMTGLNPANMVLGMSLFLAFNNSPLDDVEWAPYYLWRKADQKEAVLDTIRLMLKNNTPVVFSYYSFSKNVTLYSSLEHAQIGYKYDDNDNGDENTNGHYMTIIGLYRYLDDSAGSCLHYEYILKVVSWGNIYYIRYDQYADSLSYFSNILSVR